MEASSTNHIHPKNQGICAVVITHNPDGKFLALLYKLERKVNQIVVVDNRSAKDGLEFIEKAKESVKFILIENAENKGVAAGLNQGFAEKVPTYGWFRKFILYSFTKAADIFYECKCSKVLISIQL